MARKVGDGNCLIIGPRTEPLTYEPFTEPQWVGIAAKLNLAPEMKTVLNALRPLVFEATRDFVTHATAYETASAAEIEHEFRRWRSATKRLRSRIWLPSPAVDDG